MDCYIERRTLTTDNAYNCHDLPVPPLFISGVLWEGAVYFKSCRWVKWNCKCTQTCSSKFLLVDLPLLHAVVELLLLFWSRKESDLAHGNCPCCTEEDMAALLKPLAFACSSQSKCISTSAILSGVSIVDPKAISLSHHHHCEFLGGIFS
jgi:hypothetical protein